MIALLASSPVWSMGAGAVHPEARTGRAGGDGAVGPGLAGAAAGEAPVPRGDGAPACGADGWWRSSMSALTVPIPARTARASTIVSVLVRPGRAGRGGLAGSPV